MRRIGGDCLGISEEDMLDKKKVKLFNGIAGAAKSSAIEKFMGDRGIEYCRFTSTNKLKRDAMDRFGGMVDTIASGLFHTNDGMFYDEEKNVLRETIVIDEILQTSPRVFHWIESHVGENNIIVCTDDRQMLAPGQEEIMISAFNRFRLESYVIEMRLYHTFRARNKVTKEYYERTYKSVETGKNLYYSFVRKKMGVKPKVISINEMEYNDTDVYLCHTLEIEEIVYLRYRLCYRYESKLVPKGRIAKDPPKDIMKYPILPQSFVKDGRQAYFQIENVCTPTRYQGSEVKDNQKLYFIVNKDSKIEPREFYTVITRCYKISSVVIVICERKEGGELRSFNGKPIIKPEWAIVSNGDAKYDELVKMIDQAEKGTVKIPPSDFNEIIQGKSRKGVHVRDTAFYLDGIRFVADYGQESIPAQSKMNGILKKEPMFRYTYMNDFYRAYETSQKKLRDGAMADISEIRFPYMRFCERKKKTPFDGHEYWETKDRKEYAYGLDLKSAFPHIMKFGELATGDWFSSVEMAHQAEDMDTGYYDFWIVYNSDCVIDGAVVGTNLKDELMKYQGTTCIYIGSSRKMIGCRTGEDLHERAHKTIESSAALKEIHWGFAMKQYLNEIRDKESGEVDAYYIEENNVHQLLMTSILSQLGSIMLKIRRMIYEKKEKGFANVDCIYFDYPADSIVSLGDEISSKLGWVDFRIFDNRKQNPDGTKRILYQNYRPLRSATDIRNEKARERRRNIKNRQNN